MPRRKTEPYQIRLYRTRWHRVRPYPPGIYWVPHTVPHAVAVEWIKERAARRVITLETKTHG